MTSSPARQGTPPPTQAPPAAGARRSSARLALKHSSSSKTTSSKQDAASQQEACTEILLAQRTQQQNQEPEIHTPSHAAEQASPAAAPLKKRLRLATGAAEQQRAEQEQQEGQQTSTLPPWARSLATATAEQAGREGESKLEHLNPCTEAKEQQPEALVVDQAVAADARPQLIQMHPSVSGNATAAGLPADTSHTIPPLSDRFSGLLDVVPAARATRQANSFDCGLWSLLPEELVEIILKQCTPHQLGQLESSCSYFRGNKTIERITKQRLKAVPRAKGLKPSKKDGESYTMLLHYVQCQSAAAAQATSLSCGAYHSAVLMLPRQVMPVPESSVQPRHKLYTFGRGFHGQLGNGSHSSSKCPTPVSLGFKTCVDQPQNEEETMPAVVACGSHHSMAISRKGELFSWGLGSNGELGLGRWGPLELPIPRQCSAPSVRIVSVACGQSHTLAIAENGTLWSCGKNRHGQLGNGSMADGTRLQSVLHVGSCRIVSAAAGTSHSIALASDGSLFTWGDGSRGQLGHSQLQQIAATMPQENPLTMITAQKITRLEPTALAPESRVTAIAAGGDHSMALTVGGNILAFGANSHGQLGLGDSVDRWKPTRVKLTSSPEEEKRCLRVVQVACGTSFSVALFSTQGSLEVRTTGSNSYGQLGQGDRTSRQSFEPSLKIPDVVAVQAGDEHSAAVTAAGDLYLWGRGDSGQLGLGDIRAKWKPSLVKDLVVVHPDKTLRRNKRSLPFVRPIQEANKAEKVANIPIQ